jgi:hypothetical protein
VSAVGLFTAAPSTAVTPTYITVQLAHAEEGLADTSCNPLPEVVTLEQQAAAYKALGITGLTSTVITSWMAQSTNQCHEPYEMAAGPSWPARLMARIS